MSEENKGSIEPEFDKWDIKETKKKVLRASLRAIRRSGLRGLAVLTSVVGLAWIAGQLLNSTLDGALKALCVLGVSAALLCIALAALFTEKQVHATAKQTGRDSQDQPGAKPHDEGTTGPAANVNGRALDGRSH
jgi:hypothetical protein